MDSVAELAEVDESAALSAAACLFRSFGDPARLAILRHLALGDHRVVDLTAHLGLAQSTVSAHLACLRDCGLVESRPLGRASLLSLRHDQSILALLAAAERLLAETGDAVALCPPLRRAGSAVTTTATPSLSVTQRRRLGRRAQLLAGVSVTYNLIEAVVAVAAGAVAGSIALIGFGLDSLVEMSSGLVILWQFRHPVPESRERLALRLIGLSFFALAVYVTVESVRNLIGGGEPAPSPIGIVLAAVSLLVMPVLSWA